MGSEVGDLHDIGVRELHPLGASADPHQSDHFGSMNSSDPAPPDSSNGHLRHYLPSPDPLASDRFNLAAEIKRSEADNEFLVHEITSLRDAYVAMEHTQELLQRELLESSGGVADLISADIASLEAEKKKQEDLAACTAQEMHALHAEKMVLQAESRDTASEIQSIDVMLADITEKSSLLARDAEEKQAAMAGVQTRVNMICFEIEKLQLEKEEYSKEVSLLEASNGTIDRQINRLREEEKALSKELDQFVTANSLAEQNVSISQAHIAALNAQVSSNTESHEEIKNKLLEAKERLRHLEEEDKAMAFRERDMEMHIVDLESRLHTLKADFNSMERAAEEPGNKGGSRSFEAMHKKAGASERGAHVLKAALDAKQQHVQTLQAQMSDMHEGKETLGDTNVEVEAELKTTKEEAEAGESVQLRQDIKELEGTLSEAEERAHVSESKEVKLRCKLQELIILTERKPRLGTLATPFIISGGTIVTLALLIYFLRSSSKSIK